jgi:hypothetical protein
MRKRIFVETRRNEVGFRREVFRSSATGTGMMPLRDASLYVSGPFKTVRGAKAAVHFGWTGNPHFIDVNHFEQLGREFDKTLARMPILCERM